MPFWVLISLAAAAVQTLRFLLQKRLRGSGLSTAGATFSRFVFGAPLAWVVVGALTGAGHPWPRTDTQFWIWAAAGGLGQILGTLCTVALFTRRHFAVGVAFTKTETILVALFSAILLGEAVSPPAMAAILVGVAGVLLLSLPKGRETRVSFDRGAAILGVAGGAAFALAAVAYRAAALELGDGAYVYRASVTLACVTTLQTLMMVVMLGVMEPGQIRVVLTAWRRTALVGATGMLGSLGWFTAFTLQNAAHVRAVGQVELVFSLAAGAIVFGERITSRELIGIALIGVSVVALVLVA